MITFSSYSIGVILDQALSQNYNLLGMCIRLCRFNCTFGYDFNNIEIDVLIFVIIFNCFRMLHATIDGLGNYHADTFTKGVGERCWKQLFVMKC